MIPPLATETQLSPEILAGYERMVKCAKAAGSPTDQVLNYLAAGIKPQPKQWLFASAARQADYVGGPTMIGTGGARGGGKSFIVFAQTTVDDCQRVAGLRCLILRKVGKAVKESIEALRLQVLRNVPHTYNQSSGTITFSNGSTVILGHFQAEKDIDSYLGLEYDIIVIEEATTLTLSKVTNIRTCLRTSKPNWRPRLYLTFNPGGIGHSWVKSMLYEPYIQKREKDTRFIPSLVTDNRFINAGYTDTLDALTGWKLQAWRWGNMDIEAGAFFTTYRRGIHVIKPFEVPPHWRVWGSMDYGFQHFQAVYIFAADEDGNEYCVTEHAARGWVINRHVEAIRALLARLGIAYSRLQSFVAGPDVFAKRANAEDSETIAQKYEAQGIKLTPANNDRVNGAAQILTLLGDVDAGIAPRLFIFEGCEKIIEQLPNMLHDPNHPEDVLKQDIDEDGMGGDDGYDGFRYGVMAAPAAPKRGAQPQTRRVLFKGGIIG